LLLDFVGKTKAEEDLSWVGSVVRSIPQSREREVLPFVLILFCFDIGLKLLEEKAGGSALRQWSRLAPARAQLLKYQKKGRTIFLSIGTEIGFIEPVGFPARFTPEEI
jgi:hypothetical protein